MDNKNAYEDKKIVDLFANWFFLEAPEIVFMYKFKDGLKDKKLLDIGVGAGRTTRYFSDLVEEYVGVDYSNNMIEACRRQYPLKNFMVCDARDLSAFKDGYFDIVFFSYNGIDTLGHEDRLKILKEIKRVLKNDGVFMFSSHNLQYIDSLFSLKNIKNPILLYQHLRTILINKPLSYLKNQPYAIIKEASLNFRLKQYYVKPDYQITQLLEMGFKNIELYSTKDGCQITKDLNNVKDWWIYYLCTSM